MLLMPDDGEVFSDENGEQGGDQKDVQGVEARNRLRRRKLAAEEQERDPGADERYREHYRVGDAHSRPREQVVQKRVAEQPIADDLSQQLFETMHGVVDEAGDRADRFSFSVDWLGSAGVPEHECPGSGTG